MPQINKPIIIFDGVCNLCNSFVNFIIRHDKKEIFLFAASQSGNVEPVLRKHSIANESATVILIVDGQLYFRSEAVLKIMQSLDFPSILINLLEFIPVKLFDYIYDLMSSRRYKWFGRKDQCIIPRNEIKSRFL